MEVKVIKPFIDKNMGSLHIIDEKLNVSLERFRELTTGPLGVFVEEITSKKPPKKK